MERLDQKGNQLQQLSVIAMALSGLLSAGFVLLDTDRPVCYQLLWLLPVAFSCNCVFIYTFRKLLFARVSITIITGFYWIRMVLTPVIMGLGNYAVYTQNTSWHAYMEKAIVLVCYEATAIFILLFACRRSLDCPNQNVLSGSEKPARLSYPAPFYFAFGLLCLFFFGMLVRWPILIRYLFIPIFGAPAGWKIPVVEQRSLDGSGSGPLGIFVTLLLYLIFVMQILLPAFLLTKILNKKGRWSDARITVCSFFLIGLVAFIATESRSDAIYSAAALTFTLMAYSSKKQLRVEAGVLSGLVLLAGAGLYIKQVSHVSGEQLDSLSKLITAYFAGPQNVAACIQAGYDNGGADFSRLLYDIPRYIPYVGTIAKKIIDLGTTPSCDHLFHYALYGVTSGRAWDQVVPAIGAGYLLGGFLLAPLNPAISACISLLLEKGARRAKTPIIKNICYAGCALATCGVSASLGHALGFLWYPGIAALIAAPLYVTWRRNWRKDVANE